MSQAEDGIEVSIQIQSKTEERSFKEFGKSIGLARLFPNEALLKIEFDTTHPAVEQLIELIASNKAAVTFVPTNNEGK